MKIKIMNVYQIVIYLNNDVLGNVDINNPQQLKSCLKRIIKILDNNYHLKMVGSYSVHIHCNEIYGVIIELNKEEDDSFFHNVIDLRIKFYPHSEILYGVEDYYNIDILGNEVDKYYYHNQFYCRIKNVNPESLIRFLEHGTIIYGKQSTDIIEQGLKIK
ncbi:MAG: hypothetical protein WCZ09_02710 [Bacilli bacterium]